MLYRLYANDNRRTLPHELHRYFDNFRELRALAFIPIMTTAYATSIERRAMRSEGDPFLLHVATSILR